MLSSYITAFVSMVILVILTGAALHLAQYKKRGGCCSEGLQGTGYTKHGCNSCKCEADDEVSI